MLKATIYHQWRINVDLGWHTQPELEWRTENDRGLPFQVRYVTYDGGDKVSVSGTAIKVDGEFGVVDRFGRVPYSLLPTPVQEAIEGAASGFQCDLRVPSLPTWSDIAEQVESSLPGRSQS